MTIALIGELNAKLSWYAARAAGLIAWSVVTLSILWGLALSTRLVRRRGVPAWLLDLHKFLGTLSIVFVGVHLAAIWADTYVYFGPRELFLPFASGWRPGAVAWGIAATYLLVAIQLTSWTMKRLPRRVWHAIHLLSIPMFVTATAHGFTSGADRANLAVEWVACTGCTFVFLLIALRLLAPRRSGARTVAPAVTAPPPPRLEPAHMLPEAAWRGRSAVADAPVADAPVAAPR